MISRREFVISSSAIALAGVRGFAQTPRYDLVIKGGRVLDPSQKLDRRLDVAIRGGQIAALEANIPGSAAAEMLDATGKLVTPGLIDVHAHPNQDLLPEDMLSGAVTTVVDGGTNGFNAIQSGIDKAKTHPNRVRILINLSRIGNGREELFDLQDKVNVAATREAIQRNRDIIIGVKARISRPLAANNDLEAIRLAHEVAQPFNIPIMVHVGNTHSTMQEIVKALRPGDIVTHVYTPEEHGILDANGKLFPEVRDARQRGVRFDIGHGRLAHITWDVAEKALMQDFPPDTISTDLSNATKTLQVFDLPNVMSKMLTLGMPLDKVIECVTTNAARTFAEFKDLGTLKTGAAADVSVLELVEGQFDFNDNSNTIRKGSRKLMPRAVVYGGKTWKGTMSTSGLAARPA